MTGHATRLIGAQLPGLGDAQGRPTLVSVTEQNFIPWTLDQLASAQGRSTLAGRNALARRGGDGAARLYQPVHRSFNLVLVEAFCATDGLPRLDPRKILRAGVTLRRRNPNGAQGWITAGGQVLGWRPLPGEALAAIPQWDPDSAARRSQRLGRNAPVLGRAPLPLTALWDEAFSPLFPAPPALCAQLGKTLLYGYLPVTSDARSEADAGPEAPFTPELLAERLPVVLWRAGRREALPAAQRPLLPPANALVNPAAPTTAALDSLIAAASYLAQEPGLFTPAPGDPAGALRGLLQAVDVPITGLNSTRTLYRVLLDVFELLVNRADDSATLRLPTVWPSFTAAQEAAFLAAIRSAVSARWARLSPAETRFQDAAARYDLNAWARIDRSDHGCAPQTVWTPTLGPLAIIPWHESGEVAPTVVELPSLTPDFLGKVAPNIAFKVPPDIQQFMSGLDLKDLMDGKKPGPRIGFGMICGFSIPIITICAFIVLQIFLVLFNLLFFWLPFIRICIPFPKKE